MKWGQKKTIKITLILSTVTTQSQISILILIPVILTNKTLKKIMKIYINLLMEKKSNYYNEIPKTSWRSNFWTSITNPSICIGNIRIILIISVPLDQTLLYLYLFFL